MIKENQFTLVNGDICETTENGVINISDIERQQKAAEKVATEEAKLKQNKAK